MTDSSAVQYPMSVWRTRSDMSYIAVHHETSIPHALVQLARSLEDFELEEQVIDLSMIFDDDGYTVMALVEKYVAPEES